MTSNPNENLDSVDQSILGQLVPEGETPGSDPGRFAPGAVQQDDALAQAAAAPAATPAPAPAATSAPAATPAPTTAPAAAASPAGAPAATPAPSAAPAPAERAGDLRQALRASRHNERQALEREAAAKAEADRLRAQLEAQGGSDADDQDDPLAMSEERIAEIAKDFPAQAKTIRLLRELDARTKQQAAASAPATEWAPPAQKPAVQAVIDEVPDLLAWQVNQAEQAKFEMACDYDASLRADPLWKAKPARERFEEAVRRTQTAMGITPAAAAPVDSAAAAAAAVAAAPSTGNPGVSDFRGGGTAQPPALNFNGMTDQQILGSLVPED